MQAFESNAMPLTLDLERGAGTRSGCGEYFCSFLLRNRDECVYNLGVKLGSCTFQQSPDCFGVGKAFSVAAVCDHCIVSIDD